MPMRIGFVAIVASACLLTTVAACRPGGNARSTSNSPETISSQVHTDGTSIRDGTRCLEAVAEVDSILRTVEVHENKDHAVQAGLDQLLSLDEETRFRGLFFHAFGPPHSSNQSELAAYYLTEFVGRKQRDTRIKIIEEILANSENILELAHACFQLSMDYRSLLLDEKTEVPRRNEALAKVNSLVDLQRECLESDDEAARWIAFTATAYLGRIAEPNRLLLESYAHSSTEPGAAERVRIQLSQHFEK